MADIALIGGSALARIIVACRLRLQGISVFTELTNRKPDRMRKRAIAETWRGEAGVADITDDLELSIVASRALDFAQPD